MRKKWILSSLAGAVLFLTACESLPNSENTGEETAEQNGENGTQSGQANDTVTIENQIDSNYYRPLITEEGSYAPSKNRGITLVLNSNVNIKTFEEDLMRISHRYFSTEDHYFQEGQFLPANLVSSWLRRDRELTEEEIEDGAENLGLNPRDNGSTDPETREPIYLSSILEQDYYVETENGMELAGVSVGLALNSVDYFGEGQQQDISTEELIEEGQQIGNEVVSRMREIEGLGTVPIMIGLYEQSTRDDFAGGTYISEGVSENGASTVSDWTAINEDRKVFPIEGMESAEGNAFANFKSEVENFFPNLSGVTGVAHYIEDNLVTLQIDIMTQFYGKGEIIAFTQYLNQAANTYLPENLPIEIKVESLNGIESFLERESEETEFVTHIFD
ncbi:CamS family sex pheromone protein [Marinilactibacillus piezotolerans]|uniref:CamS family sex pheromone protein n=1 Tax=Marinilactibacillus piezotolerans TaxID=258723 RepID=UPI0009B065BF|nr:CamS family sex pheromone protein [Marinilactibacillus piezotolerans]